eukprot:scaffold4725_cov367-Prasinococcus_capsulatus_cf.AAC.7
MLRFYTDDAPGLKITPLVVLGMSLGFIGFVTVLHVVRLQQSPVVSQNLSLLARSIATALASGKATRSTSGEGQALSATVLRIEYVSKENYAYLMMYLWRLWASNDAIAGSFYYKHCKQNKRFYNSYPKGRVSNVMYMYNVQHTPGVEDNPVPMAHVMDAACS